MNKIFFKIFYYYLIFIAILSQYSFIEPKLKPLRVVAELNIGESQEVKISNGDIVKLSLLEINEIRDSLRDAIRVAYVKISVDGEIITLSSGNYNLPIVVGKVQIDCPIIKEYYSNANRDLWKLKKDARFRLWPKGSSYLQSGTFVYPVKQKWFANMTQIGNEPVYVSGGEDNNNKAIYYHECIDIGGAEGMDEIVSATDGLVISAKGEILKGYEKLKLRRIEAKDGVYILDKRGWFIRYSHLDSTDPSIKPGVNVKMGQRIGLMGKQGSSGGYVHLHYAIYIADPVSDEYQSEDAYPYIWESYFSQYNPPLLAVARPHHLLLTDQETTLDGKKSKSFAGEIVTYEWIFCDGTMAKGAVQKKSYERPGVYSEILKVTDSKGNIDYDFTDVLVYDRKNPGKTIPVIQPAYYPTFNIKPGDPVTFLVRTFNTDVSKEVWDFGDGSVKVEVKSETVNKRHPIEGKFAETIHSFSKPGHYIVKVDRSDEAGIKAIAHLHVEVKN